MVESIFDCVVRKKEEDFDSKLLNSEFKATFELVEKTNKSLFITGKAGTGKSTMLQFFNKYSKKNIVVLAPTGLAALNVEGQTIHSFFRFPPCFIEGKHIKKINNEIFKKIDTIVIDEVSMVRADLLDGIDKFMRRNGKSGNKPFGGVQMVFFGDLFQLPPVMSYDRQIVLAKYKSPYFFDSNVFKKLNLDIVELKNTYRQKDEDFIQLLDDIRTGEFTQTTLDALNTRVDNDFLLENDFVTLTPTNRLAQKINQINLEKIKSKQFCYSAYVEGKISQLPVQETLKLKVGAKVIFLRNDKNKQWVNGSLGTVHRLNQENILVRLDSGSIVKVDTAEWEKIGYKYNKEKDKIESEIKGKVTQYPLKLAWALTIHKSQGQTFDKVFIDLSTSAFAHGQTYVALSRCRTLNGIVLKVPIQKQDIIVDSLVSDFFVGR